MPIEIRRLAPDDLLKWFDCGDHKLNDYLKRHAWVNQQQNLVGVTYVAADQSHPKLALGYYTLATSAIPRDALPSLLTKDLPRYRNLPVALLARLAVDMRFQGAGLGKELLRHAFENVFGLAKQIGCRYLIVDAYPTAVDWYAKYGFIPVSEPSTGEAQPMFLDVKALETALP